MKVNKKLSAFAALTFTRGSVPELPADAGYLGSHSVHSSWSAPTLWQILDLSEKVKCYTFLAYPGSEWDL